MRSLIGCNTTPVTRRLPGSGLLVYGRGVSCELTVDEEGFSGISPYLFGLVLEHYIARHVSINTFSQMTLHSMQRGKIMTACQGGTAGKRMSDDFTQAEENPRRYGFLNLMRRVDVQLCTVPAGNTRQPRMEKISPRTNALADLCATGNRQCELAGRTPAYQPVQSRAVGPNGPLPLHYTELARNRTESRRDPTLTRFSDLFITAG